MKTTNKKEIKTKNGPVYSVGNEFDVVMVDGSSLFAIAIPVNGIGLGKPIRIPVTKLNRFFKGFIKVNIDEVGEFMEEMESSGVCKSLTGETVEVDGEDEYGFPSILKAAGMV